MGDSKKYELNKKDAQAIGWNMLIVGGAAALTYLAANVSHFDLGGAWVAFVPVISMGIDAVVKYLKENMADLDETDNA